MSTTINYTNTFLGMLNDLETDGRYGMLVDEDEQGNFIFTNQFTTWTFTYEDVYRIHGEIYSND